MLIEAFSQLDQLRFGDVQLVLVGSGPERERLEELIDQHYMGKRIVLLGEVAQQDLRVLYAGAQLFALTPRDIAGDTEGFGIVYLEAAAAGLPVLATHSGGIAEAVLDQQTGILAAPTVKAVQHGLEQLLSDEKLRARLGGAGQERAQQEFSWMRRLHGFLEYLSGLKR